MLEYADISEGGLESTREVLAGRGIGIEREKGKGYNKEGRGVFETR